MREEIDKLNVWLFENVNNAVYRAQFAESLQAFKMVMRHSSQDLRQWTNGWRIRDSYSEITLQTVTSACIQHLQDLTTAIPEISDLRTQTGRLQEPVAICKRSVSDPGIQAQYIFQGFCSIRRSYTCTGGLLGECILRHRCTGDGLDTIWSQPTGREALSKDLRISGKQKYNS